MTERQVQQQYSFGYPLIALASVFVNVAAASVSEPGQWMSILGNRVIVYIGKRSYAISS